MRQFSAEYLADTRRGLWADRDALAELELSSRERVLDVGCGTGSLAAVLAEESDAEVVCLDADPALLTAVDAGPRVLGDATRLPVADGAFDLVACQALLVNLPDPLAAVRELARASSALVAAVEPDNAAVTVESTVEAEPALAARAREAYLHGLATDATLGADAAELFESAGLSQVRTTRHDLVRETAPPYDEHDVESARRKAAATRLVDQEAELRAGGLGGAAYDELVADWKAMGRAVVDQMRERAYERTETVPFYVTVGRV
ncbi:MAG: methyltransferase domain-containing protein [Halobacteriales archaeon]|nr:methyltransferase domain-containing protein [Halobacteriales archaeon]